MSTPQPSTRRPPPRSWSSLTGIVREGQLTTLMITHNMRDAIQYGNRLIMLHDGHVILDIAGEEKKKLTVPDLLEQFTKASGDEFANDRAILS